MNSPAFPTTHQWTWRGHRVRYQTLGDRGSAVILIHGFGASGDHWRHNLAALATQHRVYALDLMGFGFSDKPNPQSFSYTFETWADQVLDFCEAVVQAPVHLIGNSIGCIVALQAAVQDPHRCHSLSLLDCSLRLLHERKRPTLPWYQQISTPIFQRVLGLPPVGQFFFSQVARPGAIANFLRQAYHNSAAVTQDLVEYIYRPALEPGAAAVFLSFIQYSHGPLAEDLLPQVRCPVLILWGAEDPWEPLALGQDLAQFDCVEDFIALPGVGHCPQDEAPDQVNPILLQWLDRQTPQLHNHKHKLTL
ncbi:alpha/beta fold hydrolase [Lyngbya confervoides]|uniref:Alpha/beta fold hydrolase n=1 Tax=Lyngbya confervoides BDU141951 TaxID=1574623 RepID=A0ABD4T006_9CYAN|nr:alpha/beta fold hydrolase [Lyngbya confervoides]MCM1981889.1 alpha/beta fold hydrolase [Lyngbya confervoides BDU141951]